MNLQINQVIFKLLRPWLLKCEPDKALQIALNALKIYSYLGLNKFDQQHYSHPVTVMGLKFPNPIGLAAGADKDGVYFKALETLGFGFIEVGTVTPRPEQRHPLPLLVQKVKDSGALYRMGFNNKGVSALLDRLEKVDPPGIVGINIGKNRNTAIDHAHEDYLYCFRKVYPRASYVTVNISSPNAEHLKALQFGERFNTLLSSLKEEQRRLTERYLRKVPLVLKIAPDLSINTIETLAQKLIDFEWEGVIATTPLTTNTNFKSSTDLVRSLAQIVTGRIPIIVSGGIQSGKDAIEKLSAGASLVQIYSGLINRGPKLIQEISEQLASGYKLDDSGLDVSTEPV